ncbi:helix-turn-helix domain-containing protein [Lonepinella sp. MS14437]|uniref:helix-turn-helix domain-containing protein n=1 Tax=Lonepinella sp. MS14437 TaxID=3003620 RepID=UPI0036D912C6
MVNIRLSVHSLEHIWLRERLLQQRKSLGLSQRALAERMGVVFSFIGKVETGDRRLDIFEFMTYCKAIELDPISLLQEIEQRFGNVSQTSNPR